MKFSRLVCAAAFCIATVAPSSWATSVAPGTLPTAFDTSDLPAGSFLASLITPVITPTFSGEARAAVYQETSTGFLSFLYQFTSDALSAESIGRITGSSFAGYVTDVFQSASAGGIFDTGTRMASTVDRSVSGEVLGFNFPVGQRLQPGETSFVFQIRTNALNFTNGTMGIIDGSAGTGFAFAPAAPIPEPQTYAMMLAGLFMLAFMIRRRTGR